MFFFQGLGGDTVAVPGTGIESPKYSGGGLLSSPFKIPKLFLLLIAGSSFAPCVIKLLAEYA